MRDFFIALGVASTVLFFSVCAMVYTLESEAGIFAKKLPTYKTLKGEYDATINGLAGALGQVIDRHYGSIDLKAWQMCTDNPKYKSSRLLYEYEIILEYYRIVEGDEDALDNFRKWKKELDATWPKEVKDVEACYDKATVI